jgi:large subunit ribosomal protein L34e
VYLYLKKKRTVPRCAVTKEKLHGITPSRPSERPRMAKRLKTVRRAYGGVLSHKALRERIIRAFLIDEQKVVKVLKAAQATTTVKAPRVPKPTAKPTAKTAAAAPQKGAPKGDKKAAGDKKGDRKPATGDKKPAGKTAGGPKPPVAAGGASIKKAKK